MMSMSTAWFMYPLDFHSSRAFECDPMMTTEQCDYYQHRWHFWYVADLVYGLPTIAFFMCAIGLFIIARVANLLLGPAAVKQYRLLQKPYAVARYLSYRGFRIQTLRWNSAPVGLLLLAFIGAVFFFCMDLIPQPYYWPDILFGNSPPLGTRSGWMSLACMPFVFATASKTNWITLVTGISHERLQVFHRWTAYAFFLLALMHTFPFIVYHTHWGDIKQQVTVDSVFVYWTGIAAVILQAWLTFASHSTIRNLGYEFFKVMHFATIIAFMIIFFWHCGGTLTSWDYFVATAAVYIPCLAYSFIRTVFEHGLGLKAHIVVEENGYIRIEIPGDFIWRPGQHCFLRFTGFGVHALSAHPFTICSTPSVGDDEADPSLVFYVCQRGGFTTKLQQRARDCTDLTTSVFVDGPYGGIDMSHFYASDRLVVIAGGSGAGWCLPLVACYIKHASSRINADNTGNGKGQSGMQITGRRRHGSGPQYLRLVLATRDISTRQWFVKTLTKLLSQYEAQHALPKLDISLYLTGEAEEIVESTHRTTTAALSKPDEGGISTKEESGSQSSLEDVFVDSQHLGRPRLPHLIHQEAVTAAERGSSMGVFLCGPTTMQNDVRNAVARENLSILKGSGSGSIYLHQEHFSWA